MSGLSLERFGWSLVVLFLVSWMTTARPGEEPVKATPCQLKENPAAYNHKVVEVSGFVSHGFEDFTLFDPDCSSWPDIWLEYGGTSASGTMYCCGVTDARTRPKQLVVEGLEIALVANDRFRQFDQLIQRAPDSVVSATIVGRFFSGKQVKYPKGVYWSGYGHMGCCSLLAIQQVVSVDPQDRTDLDYRASADQPDITKSGCGYKFLTDIQPYTDSIKAQARAELGKTDWAFSDPQRVASEELTRLLNLDENSIIELKLKRQAQGRFVYHWNPKRQKATYMVVVSRPYWLSRYAKDSKRVAWVVIAAYKSSCGEGNSVTRIR